MIIATINKHRLFIQFSKLIKNGLIHISNEKDFEKYQKLTDSVFEEFDFPDDSDRIDIQIKTGNKIIKKSIIINQR